MNIISSHASYCRKDHFFARSQSRSLQQLTWEKGEQPIRQVPAFFYHVFAVLGATATLFAITH